MNQREDHDGDDLGRFTRKYARYVRENITEALNALTPADPSPPSVATPD